MSEKIRYTPSVSSKPARGSSEYSISVSEELFAAAKKEYKEQPMSKDDQKANISFESWKMQYFRLVQDVQLALKQKQDYIVANPWLLYADDEIETAGGERKQGTLSKRRAGKGRDLEKGGGGGQKDSRQVVLTEYAKCQKQVLGQLHDLDSSLGTIRQILRRIKNRQNITQLGDKSHSHDKNPLHRYFHRMGFDWTSRFVDQCVAERERLKQRSAYLEDKTRGPLTGQDARHPLEDPGATRGVDTSAERLAERIAAKTERQLSASPHLSLEDKQMQQVKAGNEVIDEQLDTVSYKLTHLKTIATDMNAELDAQNELIPTIQDRAEEIHAQVETATNRVNRALKRLSQSYYARYFVLCIIIMGLVVYLLKLLLG